VEGVFEGRKNHPSYRAAEMCGGDAVAGNRGCQEGEKVSPRVKGEGDGRRGAAAAGRSRSVAGDNGGREEGLGGVPVNGRGRATRGKGNEGEGSGPDRTKRILLRTGNRDGGRGSGQEMAADRRKGRERVGEGNDVTMGEGTLGCLIKIQVGQA
jgi:hypothetical protein